MIAFTKWFLRLDPKPIPLARPKQFILVRGAEREMIHAVYDEDKRMRKLIVHTCDPGPLRPSKTHRWF
ncbi:MAG: hypothetical protein ACI9TH_001982 [Kiritimatiellia bacterium]|jgi:hypothetical protein